METVATSRDTKQDWRILRVQVAGTWSAREWETLMGVLARLYDVSMEGLPQGYTDTSSSARALADFLSENIGWLRTPSEETRTEHALTEAHEALREGNVERALELLSSALQRQNKERKEASIRRSKRFAARRATGHGSGLMVKRISFASPGLADFLGLAEGIGKLHKVLQDFLPVISSEGRHLSKMRAKEQRMKEIEIQKEQEKLNQARLETVSAALGIVDKLRAEHALEDLKRLARFVEQGKITSLASFVEGEDDGTAFEETD